MTDHVIRRQQYSEALSYYASLVESEVLSSIVFFDNSGSDLSGFRELYPSALIEFISEYGLDYPAHFHRGFGEFSLVRRAHQLSKILNESNSDTLVWKLTGRYRVSNLQTIIRRAPARFDIYCDVRGPWAEMSCMAWNKRGYDGLISTLPEHFATGTASELILSEVVRARKHVGDLDIADRFLWPVYAEGVRGFDGKSIQGRFSRVRFIVNAAKTMFENTVGDKYSR